MSNLDNDVNSFLGNTDQDNPVLDIKLSINNPLTAPSHILEQVKTIYSKQQKNELSEYSDY